VLTAQFKVFALAGTLTLKTLKGGSHLKRKKPVRWKIIMKTVSKTVSKNQLLASHTTHYPFLKIRGVLKNHFQQKEVNTWYL